MTHTKHTYLRPTATRLALRTEGFLAGSPKLGVHDEVSDKPSLSDGKAGWNSEDWQEE